MKSFEKRIEQLERKNNVTKSDPTPMEKAMIIQGLMIQQYCSLHEKRTAPSDIDEIIRYTEAWRDQMGEKKFRSLFLTKKKTKNQPMSMLVVQLKRAAEKEARSGLSANSGLI